MSKPGVADALLMSQWSSHQQGRVFRPSLDLSHLPILWAKQPILTENNLGEPLSLPAVNIWAKWITEPAKMTPPAAAVENTDSRDEQTEGPMGPGRGEGSKDCRVL